MFPFKLALVLLRVRCRSCRDVVRCCDVGCEQSRQIQLSYVGNVSTELGCQSGPDLLTPVNIVTTTTTTTGGQQVSSRLGSDRECKIYTMKS